MALDEQEEVREHLEETAEASGQWLDDRRQQVREVLVWFAREEAGPNIPAPSS